MEYFWPQKQFFFQRQCRESVVSTVSTVSTAPGQPDASAQMDAAAQMGAAGQAEHVVRNGVSRSFEQWLRSVDKNGLVASEKFNMYRRALRLKTSILADLLEVGEEHHEAVSHLIQGLGKQKTGLHQNFLDK